MPNSHFKGLNQYKKLTNTEVLKASVVQWMDWCFTTAGAYYNINTPTSGAYGGTFSNLQPINDPRYTADTVWGAARSNFVWESGVVEGTPIEISGVYVSGELKTTGYTVNYPEGKVVFDEGVPSTASVQLEYSFKHVKVCDVDEVPFFGKAQEESFRVDEYERYPNSGLFAEFAQSRYQFPIVAVDVAGRGYEGYELGNSTLKSDPDIICHVLAENASDCSRIADILGQQKDSKIFLPDINRMSDSGVIILDFNGNKTNTTQTYPELVADTSEYRGRHCYFQESQIQDKERLGDLHKKTVRLTCEILV
jgi:hypothetical protein